MLAEETNISKKASRAGHHPGGEGGESRLAGGGVEKGGEAMHTIMVLGSRVVAALTKLLPVLGMPCRLP